MMDGDIFFGREEEGIRSRISGGGFRVGRCILGFFVVCSYGLKSACLGSFIRLVEE